MHRKRTKLAMLVVAGLGCARVGEGEDTVGAAVLCSGEVRKGIRLYICIESQGGNN